MRDETKMDVYTSGVTGAEYDAGMKQLMSNKEIIVPILQMTVSEFKTCRILCSQRPFISVKYYYADYRLFKVGKMLFHMDLCGGCAKETAEYIDGILDYLKGLFTGDIKRIQRYSHIEWSEPFQEEASKMTGFGDMIYERGIQQGRHEGMILGALMSGKTPEEVSKMLNLPLEEIKKVQEQQMTVNK